MPRSIDRKTLPHNHRVTYFDIRGYQPHWLNGLREITAAHGPRLGVLTGRCLTDVWLAWDLDDDEWFADAPVLLNFEGEQVEINHQKFDDLSVTWNSVDPVGHATWSFPPGDKPDVHAFHLGWRRDARPELGELRGQVLGAVELLQWAGRDVAKGMIAPSFAFTDGRLTIHNALDENGLEFGAPDPDYRRHTVHG
jgi:hypothetical protein